jgi:ABC-type sugar transport system permease subunit
MAPQRSSFIFDPGWLFLVAGLVLVASAVLVPASYDLWVLRAQQQQLAAQEQENYNRLEAYERFNTSLRAGDEQLIRRLAAAQLNRIPKGEKALLLAGTANQTPLEWVDASVKPVVASVTPFPDSLLSRLTLGRKALWVAGAGVMCVFLGLLLSPLRLAVPKPNIEAARGQAETWLTRAMVGREAAEREVPPENADKRFGLRTVQADAART